MLTVIAVLRRSWHGPSGGRYVQTLGELAFGEGIAGLHEPVCGHRRVIIGVGFRRLAIMLCAGVSGRLPGRLTRGPPVQSRRIAVAPALLLAVSGRGSGTSARGIFEEVLCRRPTFDS
jgi:hypothetical protein